MIGVKAYRRLQRLGDNCEGWEMTAQAGRWLVDKTAIYQPSTHYPTTRYTPAGRYGRFFCYKTKTEALSSLRLSCPRRIRTTTNRTKTCCATITP